jgi:RNA polymerase sigma-70 factor, ECF subfamily
MTEAVFEEPGPTGATDEPEARFEAAYRGHFSDIYAYCLRRVPSDEVADMVAEIFLTAWRRLDQMPSAPEDRLWLYGVARRTVSQHTRTLLRRNRLAARYAQEHAARSAAASPEESSVTASVLELVERLPPKNREIVKLVVWEQLSHAEVAQVLGCSANAVAIRWHRSLGQLRRKLATSSGALNSNPAGGT